MIYPRPEALAANKSMVSGDTRALFRPLASCQDSSEVHWKMLRYFASANGFLERQGRTPPSAPQVPVAFYLGRSTSVLKPACTTAARK